MKKLAFLLIFSSLLFSIIACKKETQLEYTGDYVDPLALTDQEKSLIMAGDDTVEMTVMLITNYSDSLILRKQSINVTPDTNDVELMRLINRMYKTVLVENGVGIAAPQVGINRRIIWVQRLDKTGKPWEVYLNPRIVLYSSKAVNFAGDGCLSIPGVTGTSHRFSSVVVEYDLPNGTHKTEIVEGYSQSQFAAIIFQHEIDHLNGVLFIDRL
jgi:peptide deformylase